jgi:hypothetical protein
VSRIEINTTKLFLVEIEKLSQTAVTQMGGTYCLRMIKHIKESLSRDLPADVYPNICQSTYFEFAQTDYSEREIYEWTYLVEVAIAQIKDVEFRDQSNLVRDFGKVCPIFVEKYGGKK